MNPASNESTQRDSATLRILGIFFTILGVLVLIASFWTLNETKALVVNLVSGSVLVCVGTGMIIVSRRMANSATATGIDE